MRLLLVDPDEDRATTLGKALAAAGAGVTLAASGSFALTMLEWNPHDVVVSRIRLGDMDAHELCTILRDDPGLKELRFALVVWPDEVSPAPGSAGVDVILPSTMSAATMLERIGRLMPEIVPPPPEAPPPPADSRPPASGDAEPSSSSFAGSLDGIELGELARTIALAGRTGHLLVALATAGGAVAFENGRVVHAEFGDETGGPALAALVRAAHRERVGEFCFVADEGGGLRGTPRTVHQSLDELLGES